MGHLMESELIEAKERINQRARKKKSIRGIFGVRKIP